MYKLLPYLFILLLCSCNSAVHLPQNVIKYHGPKAKVDKWTRVVLDKVYHASGLKHYKKVFCIKKYTKISIIDANIFGTSKTVCKINRLFTSTSIIGLHETSGFNGHTSWSKSLIHGLRQLSGPEKIVFTAGSLQYIQNPEFFYDEVSYLGKEIFQGVNCLKIKFHKNGLDPDFIYYDPNTFLARGSKFILVEPNGKLKAMVIYDEFITHKLGFTMPSKITQLIGPTRVTIELTNLIINEDVDDTIFQMPLE